MIHVHTNRDNRSKRPSRGESTAERQNRLAILRSKRSDWMRCSATRTNAAINAMNRRKPGQNPRENGRADLHCSIGDRETWSGRFGASAMEENKGENRRKNVEKLGNKGIRGWVLGWERGEREGTPGENLRERSRVKNERKTVPGWEVESKRR